MDANTVLLIEDEPAIQKLVQTVLTRAGFHVTCASDGVSGLALLEEGPFSLLVTDQNLPGLTGLEVVRTIRPRLPELPIIVITAHTTWDGREEADALGVTSWISKPFSSDTLLEACRAAVAKNVVLARATAG